MAQVAGILEKLGGGMMSSWQKRFFCPDLDKGELKYYDATDACDENRLKGSLPLRHVEIVDRGNMFGKHTFSILTKQGKKAGKEYFLAAPSNDEKAQWLIQLMQLSGLYLRLFEPKGPPGPAEVEAGESQDEEAANVARIEKSPLYETCIKSVPENRVCSDCGAANPTWTVHEPFGVFVCIDCIGVHRSLWAGNCREIQLDGWPEEDRAKMQKLGNKVADEELEFHVPADVTKPTEYSSREIRAAFIKSKYVEKTFSKEKNQVESSKERQKASKRDEANSGSSKSGAVLGPPRYTGVVYLKFSTVTGGLDLSKTCVIIANGFQSCTSSVPAGVYTSGEGKSDVSVVQSAFPLDTLRRPLFVSFTDPGKTKVMATAVILAAVNLANVPEGSEKENESWSLLLPTSSSSSATNASGGGGGSEAAGPILHGSIKFETLA